MDAFVEQHLQDTRGGPHGYTSMEVAHGRFFAKLPRGLSRELGLGTQARVPGAGHATAEEVGCRVARIDQYVREHPLHVPSTAREGFRLCQPDKTRPTRPTVRRLWTLPGSDHPVSGKVDARNPPILA